MKPFVCIHAPASSVLVREAFLLQPGDGQLNDPDPCLDKQLVAGKPAARHVAAGGGCRRLAALVERVGHRRAGARSCRQRRSDLGPAGSRLAQSGRAAVAPAGACNVRGAWLHDRTACTGRPAGRRDLAVCAGSGAGHRGHLPLGAAGARALWSVGPFHAVAVRATPLCKDASMCRRHGPDARLQGATNARVVRVPPRVSAKCPRVVCHGALLPAGYVAVHSVKGGAHDGEH